MKHAALHTEHGLQGLPEQLAQQLVDAHSLPHGAIRAVAIAETQRALNQLKESKRAA